MLMQIDGTFVFVVISFIIFLIIIKAILFHPITKVLEQRDSFYLKNKKMEDESNEKVCALLKQKDEAISKTKEEASNIIKATLEEAKKESSLEIKRTKQFVKDKIFKNEEELKNEKQKAKEELKNQISFFVSSIVSNVLCEKTDIVLSDEELRENLNI